VDGVGVPPSVQTMELASARTIIFIIIFFLDERHDTAFDSTGVRNSASSRDISIREDETPRGTLADVLVDIFRNYHHKYTLSNPALSSTLYNLVR
jgi:hypothetical protein